MEKMRLVIVFTLFLIFLSSCNEDSITNLEYESWESFSECDPKEMNIDCINKIFTSLSEGDFPFNKELVNSAFISNETYIAPSWQLTAIHVLQANVMLGSTVFCHFTEDQVANPDLIDCPRFSPMLFVGGHPQAEICKNSGTLWENCVDQVPLNETFDFAIVKAPTSKYYLPIAATTPSVGEKVFLVSNPGFPWLDRKEQDQLSYPLVSAGTIIEIQNRTIITNTLAYPGSSGGVLLNKNGEVLGVASTLIGHMRNQGASISESLSDFYTVFVGFTEDARNVVENNLNE